MTHFNIQISIQRVEEAVPPTGGIGRVGGTAGKERKVQTLLDLKVSAETEAEAYGKAETMLAAARPPVNLKAGPDPTVFPRTGYGPAPDLADTPVARPR